MDMKNLRKVGFSEGEIKIYSTLLYLGISSVNKIHEMTGIERRNIYDILNKLIKKGLVTYVYENKKRLFRVSHPNKIIGYLEEKEHKLKEIKKDLKRDLPSFIDEFNSRRSKINAEIYRGNEGVKAIWEEMLNYKNIYWIGSGRYIPKLLPDFFGSWNKRRIKLKSEWFNLIRYEMRYKIKPMKFEHIKFLPKEFSGNPIVICIFGNKIVNFLYGVELFAFVIESKEIAENYKRYHKYLWDNVAKR
jgi:predicted transcriptional regulator